MKSGEVVIGILRGAVETKIRPAVVIASDACLVERPDTLVGILTTKLPRPATSTDYVLLDWKSAGLRAVSCFRAFVLTIHRQDLMVIGHLSERDWRQVKRGLGGISSVLSSSFPVVGVSRSRLDR